MGNVIRNYEGGGGHPCGVPPSDHGEAGEASGRRGIGYTGIGGITTAGGDPVNKQVHRTLAGNSVSVDDPTPNSGGMRAGYWLQVGRQEDKTVVEKGDEGGGVEERVCMILREERIYVGMCYVCNVVLFTIFNICPRLKFSLRLNNNNNNNTVRVLLIQFECEKHRT